MIRIRDISLPPQQDMSQLVFAAARQLRIDHTQIKRLDIKKRSVDARKKNDVRLIYTVDVLVKGREDKILKLAHNPKASIAQDSFYEPPKPEHLPAQRPVVVGFGPAGMFCALVLARAGCKPIVLERGQDAKTRQTLVQRFWETGALDPSCNVQFGEGGAGTFSDGKLNTGVNNPRNYWVLEQFADAGAGAEILFDAKPHIGTDVLVTVVQNLREEILALGGEVRFGAKLTDIMLQDGAVCGVRYENQAGKQTLACSHLVLAPGHSARDTFRMLDRLGVPMQPKAFSMGVRIEHLQKTINEAQYGAFADNPALGAADYKLNVKLPDGTSAYTFCMCPGGQVCAAASEDGGVVTNGMSYHARDGRNANAAVVVSVDGRDFDNDPVKAVAFQRQLEQAAYRAGGGGYLAPAETVGSFLAGRGKLELGAVQPTYPRGVTPCDLGSLLPGELAADLRDGITAFGRKLRAYQAPDAVLTGLETRTSSPVRLMRGDNFQCTGLTGLYPCGEGAGYAGGIMTAAVDGVRCAAALMQQYAPDKA